MGDLQGGLEIPLFQHGGYTRGVPPNGTYLIDLSVLKPPFALSLSKGNAGLLKARDGPLTDSPAFTLRQACPELVEGLRANGQSAKVGRLANRLSRSHAEAEQANPLAKIVQVVGANNQCFWPCAKT